MDKISKKARSRNMAAIKSKNTKPEMFVRKLLYFLGYRYTLHVKDLPGTPDIVLKNRKTVIFVNGCFWHQHPNCKYAAKPKSNIEFWDSKLRMNVKKDKQNYKKLKALGYKVVVIWECEIKKAIATNSNKLSAKLQKELGSRHKNNKPTVIDLFSGCGGLSLGFVNAGYEVILAVDNDKAALKTFKNNHKNTAVYDIDLSSKNAVREIKNAVKNRKIDVITAGPPCQGFSLTGPRNFDDPRNKLYLSVIEIVHKIRPKVFLIENVPGLATLYGGIIKNEIIKRFSESYEISVKVLCAADYGVPQTRKRLFFVGLLKGLGKFEFPEKTHTPETYVSCSDAISDLPERKNKLGEEEDDYEKDPITPYQKRMRGSCKKLYNHVATNHTDIVKKVIALVPEGGNYKDLPRGIGEHRRFHEAWTRYSSKRPSRTIDTGHRNHFHYKYNRIPTVRENARLQSFPDNFVFYGTRTQQNRQVGNAVPPLLAHHLAKKILEYIGENLQKNEKI